MHIKMLLLRLPYSVFQNTDKTLCTLIWIFFKYEQTLRLVNFKHLILFHKLRVNIKYHLQTRFWQRNNSHTMIQYVKVIFTINFTCH